MRVIEVSMEQRRNDERAGGTGDPRENPPTNGIVRARLPHAENPERPGRGLSPDHRADAVVMRSNRRKCRGSSTENLECERRTTFRANVKMFQDAVDPASFTRILPSASVDETAPTFCSSCFLQQRGSATNVTEEPIGGMLVEYGGARMLSSATRVKKKNNRGSVHFSSHVRRSTAVNADKRNENVALLSNRRTTGSARRSQYLRLCARRRAVVKSTDDRKCVTIAVLAFVRSSSRSIASPTNCRTIHGFRKVGEKTWMYYSTFSNMFATTHILFLPADVSQATGYLLRAGLLPFPILEADFPLCTRIVLLSSIYFHKRERLAMSRTRKRVTLPRSLGRMYVVYRFSTYLFVINLRPKFGSRIQTLLPDREFLCRVVGVAARYTAYLHEASATITCYLCQRRYAQCVSTSPFAGNSWLSNHDRGRGGGAVRLTASHQGELSSIPRPGQSRIFASGRCHWSAGFLGIFRAPPRPCIPALLHSHLISPLSALKISVQGQEARERYGRQIHAPQALHRSYAQGVQCFRCNAALCKLDLQLCEPFEDGTNLLALRTRLKSAVYTLHYSNIRCVGLCISAHLHPIGYGYTGHAYCTLQRLQLAGRRPMKSRVDCVPITVSRRRLNLAALYILALASFLHWLLHACEVTPFLTGLHLGSPLVNDRPKMNAVKYRVVSGVVWTNRTMVSSNTDTNRTGVLAVVDIDLNVLNKIISEVSLRLDSQPYVASVSQSSVCVFVRQLKATHNNPSSDNPSAPLAISRVVRLVCASGGDACSCSWKRSTDFARRSPCDRAPYLATTFRRTCVRVFVCVPRPSPTAAPHAPTCRQHLSNCSTIAISPILQSHMNPLRSTQAPVYLQLSCAFEAERRRSDMDDTTTHTKYAIATKKLLSHAVISRLGALEAAGDKWIAMSDIAVLDLDGTQGCSNCERHNEQFQVSTSRVLQTCPSERSQSEIPPAPLVHSGFDYSWGTLTQSSRSTVTADNQRAVNIGMSVHLARKITNVPFRTRPPCVLAECDMLELLEHKPECVRFAASQLSNRTYKARTDCNSRRAASRVTLESQQPDRCDAKAPMRQEKFAELGVTSVLIMPDPEHRLEWENYNWDEEQFLIVVRDRNERFKENAGLYMPSIK
ncbi:hypothetical protein PR048_033282 [Dryococelus australis]|uniref:Uncharacterized protein n=1 Tax=Dryococelus australis TaxID=614101 RepID=A0ABQ9FZV1_9NEOP|nr:hypothetical protein PR048_033282 [Dryococelus australis]